MTEGVSGQVAEAELERWLSELSSALRAPQDPNVDQAAHLHHSLCGILAALGGQPYPSFKSRPRADVVALPPDAEKRLVSCGKEVEAALRGVLSEAANRTSMREADDVFDSLFTVAGYVSLMHADPDAYVATAIRESVPESSSATAKVATALMAAYISPPLIGWTNELTKMLGQAVAAGRAKSLAAALNHAVERADALLAELDRAQPDLEPWDLSPDASTTAPVLVDLPPHRTVDPDEPAFESVLPDLAPPRDSNDIDLGDLRLPPIPRRKRGIGGIGGI
ncbi:hypothetical protein [Streptomyces sp. NPDC047043]|uniref:hypothetical protein n=1 Tax=Streptomyces sp. NPDC047043 TaxID=3154497 RepID=UPI00340926A9